MNAEIRTDVLLSTREAATYLAINEKTLHNWRSSGAVRLPFLKMGGIVRYRLADLDAFKARCLVGGAPGAAQA